ncbi:metalloregulator ArsR/SmtB family transcription factor [Endozoicomonadaceae bacterium StTr2]
MLFLCTGNSARSQLAEVMFRHMADGSAEVFSAGTDPQTVDPRVYETLEQRGIPCGELSSKTIEQLPQQSFDYVISLCDKAKDECELYPPSQALMHWDLTDPKPLSGIEPFTAAADELEERIRLFLKLNTGAETLNPSIPTEFFKILSDNTRLRILMLIEDEKELCVSDLADVMQEIQPKISRHLAQMRSLKVLDVRRQGQQMFYRLADDLPLWAAQVLQTVRMGQPGYINTEKKRLKTKALSKLEQKPKLEQKQPASV